jgi:hypothetical protein
VIRALAISTAAVPTCAAPTSPGALLRLLASTAAAIFAVERASRPFIPAPVERASRPFIPSPRFA